MKKSFLIIIVFISLISFIKPVQAANYYWVGGSGITSLNMMIYDRWGEKVFFTTDVCTGWNGTFRGKDMDAGVFFYFLSTELSNGKLIKLNGCITIVR